MDCTPLLGSSNSLLPAPGGWENIGSDVPHSSMPWQLDSTPFVLLDDARSGAPFRLYRDPDDIIIAHSIHDVVPALDRLRAAIGRGYHAAGYLAYEAGFAFEPRLFELYRFSETPLLWFGLFKQPHLVAKGAAARSASDGCASFSPSISQHQYLAAVENILELIAAGDCYQINLTIEGVFKTGLSLQAVFEALRLAQQCGWGGMLSTGKNAILSCSPEMFFALDAQTIWTKPMKGTARRGSTPTEDEAQKTWLRASPKERAENLMIVDLLRNDLSRISVPGSVHVTNLFDIETYPTLHQMTSSISAQLTPGLDAIDIIRCLFPCGSITGAPKIRAMEIIAATEQRARGPYTGSMGFISPDGQAAFNVMIRTLTYPSFREYPRFGVGSGIVANSLPMQEWQECQTKARFLESAGQLRETATTQLNGQSRTEREEILWP